MNQQTLDRAHQIISDRPGITRGELTTALATPGNKGSDRTTARIIAWLRDKQRRITIEGRGHRAIVPACVPSCVPTTLECQQGNLKDLASVPTVPTLESKGLSSSVPFGTQTGFSANSKDKALYLLPETESRMGSEQQTPENGLWNSAALSAYASGPQAEAAAHQQAETTSSSYLLAGLQDVREDILALLARSVEGMKSQNQSNGCRVGLGRLKSMTRESWEHLQYAADELSNPQAGIDEILLAIQCLAHSGIVYQAQELPWDEIHAKYPAPPSRPFKPFIHPGPIEDDIEALAAEYGYTRVVPPEPTVDPDAWLSVEPAAEDEIPYAPVVARETPAEIEVEIPAPAALEPAAPTVTSESVQEVSEAVAAPEPVPETLEERILAILASKGCRNRDEIVRDLGVNKWDAIRALNILTMRKKIIAFGCGIPSYRLAPKEV